MLNHRRFPRVETFDRGLFNQLHLVSVRIFLPPFNVIPVSPLLSVWIQPFPLNFPDPFRFMPLLTFRLRPLHMLKLATDPLPRLVRIYRPGPTILP